MTAEQSKYVHPYRLGRFWPPIGRSLGSVAEDTEDEKGVAGVPPCSIRWSILPLDRKKTRAALAILVLFILVFHATQLPCVPSNRECHTSLGVQFCRGELQPPGPSSAWMSRPPGPGCLATG